MLATGDLIHYNVGHKNQSYGLVVDVCILRIRDYGYVVDEKVCRVVWLKEGHYMPVHIAKRYGIIAYNYKKGYTNTTIKRILSRSGDEWSSPKTNAEKPVVLDAYYPIYTKSGLATFKVISRTN